MKGTGTLRGLKVEGVDIWRIGGQEGFS